MKDGTIKYKTPLTYYGGLLESLKPYNISIQRITARQCVKFLRSCEAVPLNPDCLHAAHQQRNALNLDYRIYSRIHRGRA